MEKPPAETKPDGGAEQVRPLNHSNGGRRLPARSWMPIALLVIGIIAAVLLLLARTPPVSDIDGNDPNEPNVLAQNIARNCAIGRSSESKSSVSAELAKWISGISSQATVKTSEIGSIVKKIAPNKSGIELYGLYTLCLERQALIWLPKRGVTIVNDLPELSDNNSRGYDYYITEDLWNRHYSENEIGLDNIETVKSFCSNSTIKVFNQTERTIPLHLRQVESAQDNNAYVGTLEPNKSTSIPLNYNPNRYVIGNLSKDSRALMYFDIRDCR